MKHHENCIFCKIANGEIPSTTLYEDQDFRVVLDINPATKGHCLIIPKTHSTNLYDIEDKVAAKIMPLAKEIANRLKAGLNFQGLNLIQNNEALAGQTVFHFHLHLIPRYQGDKAGIGWKPGALSEADKNQVMSIFQLKG